MRQAGPFSQAGSAFRPGGGALKGSLGGGVPPRLSNPDPV